VEQLDSALASGTGKQGLLGQDPANPAPCADGKLDDGRVLCPRLADQGRKGLETRKHRQPQVVLGCKQGGHKAAHVSLAAAGLAGDEVQRIEPDVQGYRP